MVDGGEETSAPTLETAVYRLGKCEYGSAEVICALGLGLSIS